MTLYLFCTFIKLILLVVKTGHIQVYIYLWINLKHTYISIYNCTYKNKRSKLIYQILAISYIHKCMDMKPC